MNCYFIFVLFIFKIFCKVKLKPCVASRSRGRCRLPITPMASTRRTFIWCLDITTHNIYNPNMVYFSYIGLV